MDNPLKGTFHSQVIPLLAIFYLQCSLPHLFPNLQAVVRQCENICPPAAVHVVGVPLNPI